MASWILIFACFLGQADTPPASPPPNGMLHVQSRLFDIDYEVNEESLPLTSVRLWYTLDGGATWKLYGDDEDRHPPFPFVAPAEGEFGFYMVMSNRNGASDSPPTPRTPPQLFAFVDFAPPVVQLHPPVESSILSQRVLQISWTAVDANFGSRPIQLYYQAPVGGEWLPVTSDPLANTGRFDWRLPPELQGALALRLSATDRAGARAESGVQTIALQAPVARVESDVAVLTPVDIPAPRPLTTPLSSSPTETAHAQAVRLYAEALAHRDRGEYRQAVARLRDVVRLDPEGVEALQEMGALLYMTGDYDRSLEAYNLVLAREPMQRAGILGVARVHRQRQEYETAAEKLRLLLRYNPNDAEAWMALGDIGVYKGDEILARECYLQAMNVKSGDAAIIADARQRLALMTEAARGK